MKTADNLYKNNLTLIEQPNRKLNPNKNKLEKYPKLKKWNECPKMSTFA